MVQIVLENFNFQDLILSPRPHDVWEAHLRFNNIPIHLCLSGPYILQAWSLLTSNNLTAGSTTHALPEWAAGACVVLPAVSAIDLVEGS